MELAELQNRLHEQFSGLKLAREPMGVPVFALEHGLDAPEIEGLRQALRADLRGDQRLRSAHWLAWIALAAEVGYTFDGEQYWDSFAETVPEWSDFGDRTMIRTWFRRFTKEYAGFSPAGRWAEHFNIIAGPITHGILPKDLQVQFSRAIYDLRYSFGSSLADAGDLGRKFREVALTGTSRFRKFAEQDQLVTLLVRTLLAPTKVEGSVLLTAKVLDRIIADINSRRSAKAWLADARKVVTRFSGAWSGPGRGAPAPPVARRETRLSIRPRLILRRASADAWEIAAVIPSFESLMAHIDNLRAMLSTVRCSIVGGAGTWSRGTWLLDGPNSRRLETWPGSANPIIKLSQPNAILDALLAAEGGLSTGAIWLCRVGPDGRALEISGRVVRPGQQYVLLHEAALPPLKRLTLPPVPLLCAGVSGSLLTLGAHVDDDEKEDIRSLGLALSQTVRVWPAGFGARNWDGEGDVEWLSTDEPVIAILSDHAVSSYALSLDDGPPFVLSAPPARQPVFVSLSQLSIGVHRLIVTARAAAQIGQAVATGEMRIGIREPAESSRLGPRGAIAVYADPYAPTLDHLLNDDLQIDLHGPLGRKVKVSLSPCEPGDFAAAVMTIELPATISSWRKLLSGATYDGVATIGRASLVIAADELGEHRITLEREMPPVRWARRRQDGELHVKLVDDTGGDTAPAVWRYRFAAPTIPVQIEPETVRSWTPVEPPGELLHLSGTDTDDVLIVGVPPKGPHYGFDALGVPVGDLPEPLKRREGLLDLHRLLALWSRGVALDSFGERHRLNVSALLEAQFIHTLCGPHWKEAEGAFKAAGQTEAAWAALADNVGLNQMARSLAAAIRLRHRELLPLDHDERGDWYADRAERFSVTDDRPFARFAWRIAWRPQDQGLQNDPEFDQRLSELPHAGILMRGARLAALSLRTSEVAA